MPHKSLVTKTGTPNKLVTVANHHFDSRRWLNFPFRTGDIVISSWAKSGTTWLQQIVCQAIHGGEPDLPTNVLSPWVDFRLTPLDEVIANLQGQASRRVMKSHLPADALPIVDTISYLYIARHPIDTVWSWYKHHTGFSAATYRALNDTPGRFGPPLGPPDPDFRRYFYRWLYEDGFPFHPYWSNVDSWWAFEIFLRFA